MRLLCQQIATRANREDREVGKSWQSRFRAVRLLDESALLACADYVDLNPIRAAMAQTLETCDYTSAQRRIQAMRVEAKKTAATSSVVSTSAQKPELKSRDKKKTIPTIDGFLTPLALNERTGKVGAVPSRNGMRCSDKGFLPISREDYLSLLDWTARQPAAGKRGRTPPGLKPLFERLALDAELWLNLVNSFGKLFFHVAGLPGTIEATASRVTHKHDYVPSAARKLFSATGRITSS